MKWIEALKKFNTGKGEWCSAYQTIKHLVLCIHVVRRIVFHLGSLCKIIGVFT
jgi:hypothetical protein